MEENVVQEQTQTVVEQPAPAPVSPSAEQNLINMRKKLEAEERARKELERKLAEIEKQKQAYQEPDDEPVYNRKIQELENKLSNLEAQQEIERLKDFNEIVTDDNLATFARLYPEDYATLLANPNMKAKAKTAYNMIKNYGIATKATPALKQAETIAAVDKKIEQNKLKPSTISASPAASPLSRMGRYNEEGRLILSDADAERINREVRQKLSGSY